MPNVSQNVFNAVTTAAASNKEITQEEFVAIKTEMVKSGGIDADEQAVLTALETGSAIVLKHGTEKATISPSEVKFPAPITAPDIHEQTLDKTFLLNLASKSDAEITDWYRSHPDEHKQLQGSFNAVFEISTQAEEVKLRKLGTLLQKLDDVGSANWATEHYRSRKTSDIAKEFVSRVADPRDSHEGEVQTRKIAEDLRMLAVSGKKGGRALEEQVFQALSQALEHREHNGTRSIQPTVLAEKISELQGPGSAEVKAHFLKLVLDKDNLVVDFDPKDKALVKGKLIEEMLRSDPIGVVNELEYMADRNPDDKLVLDKALAAVVKNYEDQPDQAADLLGEILGKSAREYADACTKEPPDMALVAKLSHNMGYLLRSVENTVGVIAKSEKTKIDGGAFIARVFSKGVSMLTFGIIDKVGKRLIEHQKKSEYKEVEQWQKGINSSFQEMMRTIFMSREPSGGSGSDKMETFKQQQNQYETAFKAGYTNHVDEEQKQTDRTYR